MEMLAVMAMYVASPQLKILDTHAGAYSHLNAAIKNRKREAIVEAPPAMHLRGMKYLQSFVILYRFPSSKKPSGATSLCENQLVVFGEER